jgi:hypothetical protein
MMCDAHGLNRSLERTDRRGIERHLSVAAAEPSRETFLGNTERAEWFGPVEHR